MFFLLSVKILMVHKCFQSLTQAKQTPLEAGESLDWHNNLEALQEQIAQT